MELCSFPFLSEPFLYRVPRHKSSKFISAKDHGLVESEIHCKGETFIYDIYYWNI